VPNEEQVRFWNGPAAAGLIAIRGLLEDAVLPYGLAAMEALGVAGGERVLDVGCGLGTTTRDLARRVGPTGSAVGVDVGAGGLAKARAESSAAANASYLLADAQTHPFAAEFDLCYSRFGLMFFDDPEAAFRNLRRALRPRGRLAAVVWGPPAACDWVTLPLRALRGLLPSVGPPKSSGPGPFSLSGGQALAALLGQAAFSEARADPLPLPMRCGATAAQAASFLLRFGPAAAALREAGPEGERIRPRVEELLVEALAGRVSEQGVVLPSQALLVTARAL